MSAANKRRGFADKFDQSRTSRDNTQYDIREDEEQYLKESEILQLLVTAGYFRARIKGLTTFDKVVGGMCWCIQLCAVDIDIDLLFREDLNIGQKIALTETIVRVLSRMKCPYPLEPHQIQGSDFIHIFPAVQWLVKQALTHRDACMAAYKRSAVGQYEQQRTSDVLWKREETLLTNGALLSSDSNLFPTDSAHLPVASSMMTTLNYLHDIYKPERKFKKPRHANAASELAQVQTTLMEYGRGSAVSLNLDASADRRSSTAQNSQDDVSEMAKNMSQLKPEVRLASSTLTNILGLRSDELQHTLEEYTQKSGLLLEALASQPTSQSQHDHTIETLKDRVLSEQQSFTDMRATLKEQELIFTQHAQSWNSVSEAESQLDAKLQQFNDIDMDEESRNTLAKIEQYNKDLETLKKDEQDFKSKCKEEYIKLQNQLDLLKGARDKGGLIGDGTDLDEQKRLALVQQQLTKEKNKLAKARLKLAQTIRDTEIIERRLDEIPTQWEINQYQRRFMELYEQMQAKHRETKRVYDLFNTMESTRDTLQKEVNLLNSVYDNFEKAMQSQGGRVDMVQQLEKIVEIIRQLKLGAEKKRDTVKQRRDQLNVEVQSLVDLERKYLVKVKELQDECRKHENLQTKFNELGIDAQAILTNS